MNGFRPIPNYHKMHLEKDTFWFILTRFLCFVLMNFLASDGFNDAQWVIFHSARQENRPLCFGYDNVCIMIKLRQNEPKNRIKKEPKTRQNWQNLPWSWVKIEPKLNKVKNEFKNLTNSFQTRVKTELKTKVNCSKNESRPCLLSVSIFGKHSGMHNGSFFTQRDKFVTHCALGIIICASLWRLARDSRVFRKQVISMISIWINILSDLFRVLNA